MIEWKGFPVSLNNRAEVKDGLFRLTREYRDYKKSIEIACHGSCKPVYGYVDLHLKMWLSVNKDTDNYLKGICDGIKDAGVIIDDKYIRNIYVDRYYIKEQYSKFQIELREIDLQLLSDDQKEIIVAEGSHRP